MKIWKSIKAFFKWWWEYVDNVCPNCGYYCHGKSVFCNPPIKGAPFDEYGWDKLKEKT